MAMRHKTKNKKSLTSTMVGIFMFVFIVVVSINFISQVNIYSDLKSEERVLQKSIDEQKQMALDLAGKKEYFSSDAYIEKIAREQLGLIKSNEILFVNRSK